MEHYYNAKGKKCFDKAIAINPDYNDAFVIKSLTLQSMGKFLESLECLSKFQDSSTRSTFLDTKNLFLNEFSKYFK